MIDRDFCRPRFSLSIVIMTCCWLLFGAASAVAADYAADVKPFLQKHCVACHQGDDARGQLDLKSIIDGDAAEHYEAWEAVAERLQTREMPPEDKPQPTDQEREAVLDWYFQTLVKSVKARPAPMRPRRLCAVEYRNTMKSLFGFDLEVAIIEAEQTVVEKSLVMKLLPTDPPGKSGFCNDTHAAPLTTVLWDQYSYLADAAIEELFSTKRREILEDLVGRVDGNGISAEQSVRLVRTFATRAFRRPVSEGKLASLTDFPRDVDIEGATKAAIKRVLMSPQFLYRGFGVSREQPGAQQVDPHELAERLSYFFGRTCPTRRCLPQPEPESSSRPSSFARRLIA